MFLAENNAILLLNHSCIGRLCSVKHKNFDQNLSSVCYNLTSGYGNYRLHKCIDRHMQNERIACIFQVYQPWNYLLIKWESKLLKYKPVMFINTKIFGHNHHTFGNRDVLFFRNRRSVISITIWKISSLTSFVSNVFLKYSTTKLLYKYK